MTNQMLGIVQTGKEHKRENITSYSRNVLHFGWDAAHPEQCMQFLTPLLQKSRKDVGKGNKNGKGIGPLLMRRLFTD